MSSKYLQRNLITEEDIPTALNQVNQELQVYTFDKVINDTFSDQVGIQKLYNTVIRPKITYTQQSIDT